MAPLHVATLTESYLNTQCPPCERNIISPIKYIRVCVMPSPPEKFDPEDIEGDVKEKIR